MPRLNHTRLRLSMLIVTLWLAVGCVETLAAQAATGDTIYLTDGWSYRWQTSAPENGQLSESLTTGGWRSVRVPYNPPRDAHEPAATSAETATSGGTSAAPQALAGHRTLWLRYRLPAFDFAEPALLLPIVDQAFEVYLDRPGFPRIYQYGGIDPDSGAVRFPGFPWHVVALAPYDAAGRTLYFRVRSSHANIGLGGKPALASHSTHIVAIVHEDIDRVAAASAILFSGMLLFALYLFNRKQKLFFAFGVTCLTAGGYLITRTFLKQLIVDAPIAWGYLELLFFYTIPVGLYLYFEALLGAGPFAILRRGWQAQLLYVGLACGAVAAGVVPAMWTLLPAQILFMICLAAIIFHALRSSVAGNTEARMAAAGIVGTGLFAVHDLLLATDALPEPVANIFIQSRFIGHYGALLFVLSLAAILIRKIAVTGEMLEKTSKYLSRVIKDLDRNVQSRTRALQDSRDEIAKISEVARQINATVELDEILDQIFEYIQMEFNIEAVILQFVDRESEELYSYKTTAPANATREMIDFSRNLRVPINERAGGMLYRTYIRKRSFYLAKVDGRAFPDGADRHIIDALQLNSFLVVPLIIQNEVIAMALFTSYNHRLELSRENINQINRFCDQIAGAIHHSRLLKAVEAERQKSDNLLLNILPAPIAVELRTRGSVEPQLFDSVSILFTDIQGFTSVAANLAPRELVNELDQLFEQFDSICQKYHIEKLKTIGDAYMCAGGLPEVNLSHPVDVVLAALEIQAFMKQTGELTRQVSGEDFFELRVGIHTGQAMAGIIGKHKFAYDVWGDAVNVASRMESNGKAGLVNISQDTYDRVKHFFECEYRGKIEVKNRGSLDMYFVTQIRPELSVDGVGRVPNAGFQAQYENLRAGRRLSSGGEVQAP